MLLKNNITAVKCSSFFTAATSREQFNVCIPHEHSSANFETGLDKENRVNHRDIFFMSKKIQSFAFAS